MFSVSVSASKCVTEPAFDVGRFVASPIANTFGAAFVCSVCGSVGTKPVRRRGPGAIDVRGAGVQRDRHEQVEWLLPLVVAAEHAGPPSTSPALNSVTTWTRFDASSPDSILDAGAW